MSFPEVSRAEFPPMKREMLIQVIEKETMTMKLIAV